MLPWSAELAGRLEEHVVTSELLRGNPLNDPSERPLLVYTPPGYDDDPGRRYPSVYVIIGFTGHTGIWRNRTPYRQPFPETADAVFANGEAPPAIVVFVDAWTAHGGSQFIDSPGTGRYHSYMCDEIVPWVDAHYRTLDAPGHRAISGKSSGGYGAMITPMLRPDLFGALATHAGDALFEYCYLPEFPQAVRHLRGYDGDIMRWWADFNSRVSFTRPEDMVLLNLLGMTVCYSAREDGTPELPTAAPATTASPRSYGAAPPPFSVRAARHSALYWSTQNPNQRSDSPRVIRTCMRAEVDSPPKPCISAMTRPSLASGSGRASAPVRSASHRSGVRKLTPDGAYSHTVRARRSRPATSRSVSEFRSFSEFRSPSSVSAALRGGPGSVPR